MGDIVCEILREEGYSIDSDARELYLLEDRLVFGPPRSCG